MKILKFSIIVALLVLLFTTYYVDNKYYITNDKGIVVSIKKAKNDNEVTIMMIKHPDKINLTGVETYVTFLTHKQYNINDTIYFTN